MARVPTSQLAEQMLPFELELSTVHLHCAPGPRAANLAGIEAIAPAPSFGHHRRQVGIDRRDRPRMSAETSELWMMTVAAGFAAEHGLRQKAFPPERYQATRIEVDWIQRPEPHVVNEHYRGPQGLRQGPRAGSNFAIILNQDLR